MFLYNISAGLMKPCDTDTGLGFINKANYAPYLAHVTRFEGAGATETAFTPPTKILY
jgi:cold shock CspA family protein